MAVGYVLWPGTALPKLRGIARIGVPTGAEVEHPAPAAPASCLARTAVGGFREMAAGALDGLGRGDYTVRFGAGGSPPPEMTVADVSPWLLEMLVCPLSKARVVRVGDWLYSTDPQTRRRYPIRHGIPNMLVEESEVVDPQEFERTLAACASQEQQRHP